MTGKIVPVASKIPYGNPGQLRHLSRGLGRRLNHFDNIVCIVFGFGSGTIFVTSGRMACA